MNVNSDIITLNDYHFKRLEVSEVGEVVNQTTIKQAPINEAFISLSITQTINSLRFFSLSQYIPLDCTSDEPTGLYRSGQGS